MPPVSPAESNVTSHEQYIAIRDQLFTGVTLTLLN